MKSPKLISHDRTPTTFLVSDFIGPILHRDLPWVLMVDTDAISSSVIIVCEYVTTAGPNEIHLPAVQSGYF